MHFNPQKSCEARAEIGTPAVAADAASNNQALSHPPRAAALASNVPTTPADRGDRSGNRRLSPGPWSAEVHRLSEGFSAIVYDARGWMIADHLTAEDAQLMAASWNLLVAAKAMVHAFHDGVPEGLKSEYQALVAACADAEGFPGGAA